MSISNEEIPEDDVPPYPPPPYSAHYTPPVHPEGRNIVGEAHENPHQSGPEYSPHTYPNPVNSDREPQANGNSKSCKIQRQDNSSGDIHTASAPPLESEQDHSKDGLEFYHDNTSGNVYPPTPSTTAHGNQQRMAMHCQDDPSDDMHQDTAPLLGQASVPQQPNGHVNNQALYPGPVHQARIPLPGQTHGPQLHRPGIRPASYHEHVNQNRVPIVVQMHHNPRGGPTYRNTNYLHTNHHQRARFVGLQQDNLSYRTIRGPVQGNLNHATRRGPTESNPNCGTVHEQTQDNPNYGAVRDQMQSNPNYGVVREQLPGNPNYETVREQIQGNPTYGAVREADSAITIQPAPAHTGQTPSPGVTTIEECQKNMILSIAACVCCCWLIGIGAIVKSAEAKRAVLRGDREEAAKHVRVARKFITAAIAVGLACIVGGIINLLALVVAK